MDTYPPEYLLHPVPVLAIYGLQNESQHETNSTATLVDTGETPPSPPNTVASTLLNILLARQEFNLYDASRYVTNAAIPPPFRVMAIPKNYMLPSRPPIDAHSPLSPLSSDSPLYPDGLMTPQWIKKHLELPSVVVGCYDLWDWSKEPGSPPRPKRETGPLASHLLIDPTEREKDTALAHEINERRKYFQDKGVKFAVVILQKDKHLDGSAVEERCSIIRKQSGLDAKTSFFTLAPGSIHDLQEFVNLLYRSLSESALQYYNNLIKRTRKKKSKLPSQYQQSKAHTASYSPNEPQPLNTAGWVLRYDIKTAIFYEFKQDVDSVTRILENAYTSLADFLAPTTNSTPGLTVRSTRWVEARTLADCMNIKICQFYLYQNDASSALAQLNGHLHMFQSYSSAWGMGEQSFEYWAWLSKQYRIFADIIDVAIQHGFKVPTPSSSSYHGSSNMPGSPQLGMGLSHNDADGGCNPGAILQHPGFYYHLAAMCSAERRRRYLEMNKLEASNAAAIGQQESTTMLSVILNNERQVDHSTATIELLTKSYEQFKRYYNGRMTLYLAAEIAGTYYETGKFEMALKFFERIGKTYRKERWHTILTSILRWSLRCAKELGSWERAIEFLVELLSDALPMSEGKRSDVQTELLTILDKQTPSSISGDLPRPVLINMNQINAFVQCHVQFRSSTNFVNTPLDFQITLQVNPNSLPTSRFRFSAMRILFSDSRYNYYLVDSGDLDGVTDASSSSPTLVDCSHGIEPLNEDGDYLNWKTKKVNLGLSKKQTKVIQGLVLPESCDEIKIIGVCLDIATPNWTVTLNYSFEEASDIHPSPRRKWLQQISDVDKSLKFRLLDGRGELNTVRIMQRSPSARLSIQSSAPALLDELFPLEVTLTNDEPTAIVVTLHVEMKNAEGQVNEDYITFNMDDNAPKQSIGEIELGQVDPSQSITKSVYLYGSRLTGSRLITLTARYTSVGSADAFVEKSESIRIPFVTPFDTNFEVCAQNEATKTTVESVLPDTTRKEKWLLVSSIRCCSTWDLLIDKIELHEPVNETDNASLILLSKLDDFSNQKWRTGHVYNANYLFQTTLLDVTETLPTIHTGSITIFWRRYDQDGPLSKTNILLPPLTSQQPVLTVLADVPSEIYLGEPITLTYQLNNPTTHVAEYSGSIELSDAFVFSGYKQLKGRILPLTRTSYHYVCYPLLAGKVRLPRLKVMVKQNGVEKEVPSEMVGKGSVMALDNDLHPKHGLLVDDSPSSSLPTFVFVNARRI